jgi:branched-subunit amino acid ABC-type transport system permease component
MLQTILGQLISGLAVGMVFFLIAVGLSMVFGTLRVLNVAHASFYMLGAYFCYTITHYLNSFWISLVLAPLGVAIFGGVVELLVLRPLYRRELLYQLILTFGLILIIGDLVKLTWGVDFYQVAIPWPLHGTASFLGTRLSYYHLFLIAMGTTILGLIWVILHKTKLGRIIKSVTHSRDMSSALGVNVSIVYTAVFMFASWLAGMGGTLMAPMASVFLGMDFTVAIECFIIIVIGGFGSTGGAFLGAIVFGLANSLGILVLPKLAIAFGFIAMAFVLIIRPWGLMGKEIEL